MKALLFLSIFILFYCNFSKASNAAGLSLSSNQNSLNQNDEFNVNVNFYISSANGTSYYLRGVFYQTAGNYCGYTWNGNSWYNGSYSVNNSWQQLLPVVVNQESWSGQLKAKLDTSDGNCQNSGNYYFKIQRYTTGGSSSFDDQNTLILAASIPTPTLTPTNSPTPNPTNTSLPTPTHTQIPTKAPTPSSVSIPSKAEEALSVSAKSSENKYVKSKKIIPIIKIENSDRNLLPKILILIGFVFILACAIVISYPYIKEFVKNKYV